MKTTLDLHDPLFAAAKALAQEKQTTLRALVEEGLRMVLAKRELQAVERYQLPDCSVAGALLPHLQADASTWQHDEMDYAIARLQRSQINEAALDAAQ